MKERGAGVRRELNWVLISRTREGMEEEELEGGEGEVGERANTGTAQRDDQMRKREMWKKSIVLRDIMQVDPSLPTTSFLFLGIHPGVVQRNAIIL